MNDTRRDRVLLAVAIALLWQLSSWWRGPYWISSPWLVAERLWTLSVNGELWFHARFTIAEALVGFIAGACPGCVTALALRLCPRVERVVLVVAAIGYAVPKTALVPLFVLWLGVGPLAKIALVASAVYFIVFYSTWRGVKAISQPLLLSTELLGASPLQLIRHVALPSIVPYVFGGFRVAVPYSIAGAIVGEIVSSNRGLGYLIQYGAMDFDTTLIFAALVAVMLIVLGMTSLLDALRRRLLRWQSDQWQPSGPTVAA